MRSDHLTDRDLQSCQFQLKMSWCVCAQMLAHARGLGSSRLLKLAQVQTELKASLEEMLALVDEVLHPEPYSRDEICKILGVTAEQFSTELLSANTQHGEPQHPAISVFFTSWD